MLSKEGDFSFEIKEHLGIVSKYSTGWTRELNIVAWNGGNAKFDIRDWDHNHEHMSRGITLKEEEALAIVKLITQYFEKESATEIKENC